MAGPSGLDPGTDIGPGASQGLDEGERESRWPNGGERGRLTRQTEGEKERGS